MLWMESGKRCPYTGDQIGFDDLFSGNPRFDVEHIWPRSKSLDNSMRNKTLCRKDASINAKGNRIPVEYLRQGLRSLAGGEGLHLENGRQGSE